MVTTMHIDGNWTEGATRFGSVMCARGVEKLIAKQQASYLNPRGDR